MCLRVRGRALLQAKGLWLDQISKQQICYTFWNDAVSLILPRYRYHVLFNDARLLESKSSVI